MEASWTKQLFLVFCSNCSSIDDSYFILEKIRRHEKRPKHFHQTNRLVLLKELQNNFVGKYQVEKLKQRSGYYLQNETKRQHVLVPILKDYYYEFRALEMESRHNYASIAQLVSAICPKMLNVETQEEANRLRHDMFLEKVATEPREFLLQANVPNCFEAIQRLRKVLRQKMTSIPLCCGVRNSFSELFFSVFADVYLSEFISTYLSVNDILNLGICSRGFQCSVDKGMILWLLTRLNTEYSMHHERNSLNQVESIFLRQQHLREEDIIKNYLSCCRSLAQLISNLFKRFSIGNSSYLLYGENKISTSANLLVVRRSEFV